jgi:hypothetical protein
MKAPSRAIAAGPFVFAQRQKDSSHAEEAEVAEKNHGSGEFLC